jgi:hypothetical protein
MLPAPVFIAFDAEYFLGQFGSRHGRPPIAAATLSMQGKRAIAVPRRGLFF